MCFEAPYSCPGLVPERNREIWYLVVSKLGIMLVSQIPAQQRGSAGTETHHAYEKVLVARLTALPVICHCFCVGYPAAPLDHPEGPAAGQAACAD